MFCVQISAFYQSNNMNNMSSISCFLSNKQNGATAPRSSFPSVPALSAADIDRILSNPLGLGNGSPELIHKLTLMYENFNSVIRSYIDNVAGFHAGNPPGSAEPGVPFFKVRNHDTRIYENNG